MFRIATVSRQRLSKISGLKMSKLSIVKYDRKGECQHFEELSVLLLTAKGISGMVQRM